MNLHESLFSRISADSGIGAIIGAGSDCKAYPIVAPQDKREPFLVYQTISGSIPHAFGSDAGVRDALFQFASWDSNLAGALALAAAVEACLMDFSGTLGGAGGVTVQRIFLESPVTEDFDPNAGPEGLYVARQEFRIWHE